MAKVLKLEDIDNRYFEDKKPVIVIGFFDGVHLGHKKIIEACVNRAKEIKGTGIVLTFNQPPMNVIKNRLYKRLIISYSEKIKIIESLGADYIVTADFGPDFLKLDPDKFCRDILVGKLHISEILVGEGFRFGYRAEGDINFLKRFFKPFKVRIDTVSALKIKGEVISSTSIRKYYSLGEIGRIKSLLGRDPKVEGKVVRGSGRGKKLGFPTANIDIPGIFIIPKDGVYLGKIEIGGSEGKPYPSVINIGYSPTFEDSVRRIEAFIINYGKNIYGRKVKINFLERLRDEIKFADKDSLVERIKMDLQYACKYFNIKRC